MDGPQSAAAVGDEVVRLADELFPELANRGAYEAVEAGGLPSAEWQRLTELGLPAAALPEEAGGLGGLRAAFALLRPAGRGSLPLPLGETLLASHLLHSAGLPVPGGPLTIAPSDRRDTVTATPLSTGWRLDGVLHRLPWAAVASRVALLARAGDAWIVASIDPSRCTAFTGRNLAGEPRTTLHLDRWELPATEVAPAPAGLDAVRLQVLGAAMRAAQIAGGLETALAAAVRYAGERVQFGRPIGRFQIIQQYIAVMAGHTAAAVNAAEHALAMLDTPGAELAAAAAKIRAGEAVSPVAQHAHQVHGAMGFTHEHSLHHTTRRLWAWRDEFGSEAHWAALLGSRVAAAGPDGLWSLASTT